MGVKSILWVFVLLFLVSCSYEETVNEQQSKPLIFVVDGNDIEDKTKTFVVTEDSPLTWFEQTKEERYKKNMIRSLKDYKDEQEEIAFRQKFANVRRVVENDFGQSVLISGYDKELDNPKFKEVKKRLEKSSENIFRYGNVKPKKVQ
tara:strand:+ start:5883 stop:6323 length:441 start_codon:yes stop_codon:yes gene_type:complete